MWRAHLSQPRADDASIRELEQEKGLRTFCERLFRIGSHIERPHGCGRIIPIVAVQDTQE